MPVKEFIRDIRPGTHIRPFHSLLSLCIPSCFAGLTSFRPNAIIPLLACSLSVRVLRSPLLFPLPTHLLPLFPSHPMHPLTQTHGQVPCPATHHVRPPTLACYLSRLTLCFQQMTCIISAIPKYQSSSIVFPNTTPSHYTPILHYTSPPHYVIPHPPTALNPHERATVSSNPPSRPVSSTPLA